ncbi:MAG TPA: hypothetical protein VNO50_03980 [Pyrinomonadaceae bacterium]|nr:hypothetical protein [Pyrinomonadaceae bacterium]
MRRLPLFSIRALSLKRAFTCLLLIFSFMAQLGCDRQQAVSLAGVGVETSTTLFTFYETLAQHTNETREMEVMWVALSKEESARHDPCNPPEPQQASNANHREGNAIPATLSTAPRTYPPPRPARQRPRGPDFGPAHQKEMTDRVAALRSRASMARQLSNFLTVLKTYSESDPGAKVEEAANKLGGAVASLVPIPGIVSVIPLLSGFAGDLKRWQQHKNIKEQLRVVQAGLSKVREFYAKEAGAYTSILQDNSVSATMVLQELIKLELVTTWTVFKKLPEPYGMQWAEVADDPEKRDEFKCAFIKLIRLRNDRFMANAKSATDNLQDALNDFDSKITDFLNKKTVSWESTQAALGRAKFYLKEINNMRSEKESDE